MTREQAINSMISHGFTVEQAGEIFKAVTPQLSVPEVTALAEWTTKLTKASEDAYNKGYADGMKAQEPRWIPVSERLPETDDEVLCWYEYYHWSQEKVLPEYGIGCYFKETSKWYGEVAVGRDVRVIAWMPLQRYKAETEET